MNDKLEWLQGKGKTILSSNPQRYSGALGTIDVMYKVTRKDNWIYKEYLIAGREAPWLMSMTRFDASELSTILEYAKETFQKQHEAFLELFANGYEYNDENLISVPRGIGFEHELLRLIKIIYADEITDGYTLSDEHVFETFELRPDHDNNHKPNFHYKPTDLQISWYKYPLRSATCNQQLNLDEFAKVIDKCIDAYMSEASKETKMKVKSLIWEEDEFCFFTDLSTATINGLTIYTVYGDEDVSGNVSYSVSGLHPVTYYPSRERAKEACQQHYEDMIMSGLEDI